MGYQHQMPPDPKIFFKNLSRIRANLPKPSGASPYRDSDGFLVRVWEILQITPVRPDFRNERDGRYFTQIHFGVICKSLLPEGQLSMRAFGGPQRGIG